MPSAPRLLVVMGSGETTPTMVTLHQRLLGRLGTAPDAVLLDTPYGFQENADELTRKALTYFDRNVGTPVRAVQLRRGDGPAAAREAAINAVAEADWLFAGPGSPSYALSQWRGTRLPAVLRERLARPGITIFASAAAVTLGRYAVPVYEIYKVGQPPHWLEGLDMLGATGLDCVVIPHFDNAEGGTHDTRYCYLGERRLLQMEAELPDQTWVLGVDEHTAAIIDLDAKALTVDGRGAVTVRARGQHTVFAAGATAAFAELEASARGEPAAPAGAADAVGGHAPSDGHGGTGRSSSPLLEQVAACRAAFADALAAADPMAATDAVLGLEQLIRAWSSDSLQSDELDHAVRTLRSMITKLGTVAGSGLHDHRDLVAPYVETLIDLRARARATGAYATADRIRDDLVCAGVEVQDTDDGTDWIYREP